jgi:glutamate-1-semialdehyde 2,1-aminomutase
MNVVSSPNITLDDALQETVTRFCRATSTSRERHDRACDSLPGGNTRTVLHYAPYPVSILKGKGARLWDVDNNVYTDFLGEYTAGLYGHSNPEIRATIRAALDDGILLCAPNTFESELAALLCARFSSCQRVRFCNSGTEANLMALSAARVFTKRDKILVFNGGYHGGLLYFAHGASPVNAPYPFVVAEYNDIEGTLALVKEHRQDLAAILVEPMQGAGGCIPAQADFLHALRSESEGHGVVLIFDEVMTSRLSPGGYQELLGIEPDLTSFGKYLGGGLSFGAFGGREDIMLQFDPRRADALPHAGTFNNNVLSMAAGLTGLRDIYTPELALEHNKRGDAFRGQLNALTRGRGVEAQVTGVGSIMCVHFTSKPIQRAADTHADGRVAMLFHLEMLLAGFYQARRGFMSLSLPLDASDYAGFLAAFSEFIDTHGRLIGNT